MSHPRRKLRVGVTLHLRDDKQSIWENGIFQNCAFLVQLLNKSPAVKRAVLVNAGDNLVIPDAMMMKDSGLAIIGLVEALQTLDVIIEMSALLPEDFAAAFHEKGGKYLWMRVGNDYVIDIERSMFGKPGGSLVSSKHYDAVWTLPQYEHICKDYFALTTRSPVRILPHVWTPYFFDKGIATLNKDVSFGYKPGKPRWRVCSFEPNMCLVKTSIFPMLCVEEAYRARPGFLERFHVLNTFHLRENHSFYHFAKTLDIVNHGMAGFEGRFPTYEFMAHSGDCIISHQWENAQNYLYYEALYGGYPLVHNSPIIKDYGYYYPDFECEEGGRALLLAFDEHDSNLEGYRAQGARLLKEIDIANPGNIETYTRELLSLYDE